ncbi:MAG: hypothetical protein HZA36_01470 [Parcubacteria group bacterium]|nr:hypothetical protein [Parcubacteria group bacterium]
MKETSGYDPKKDLGANVRFLSAILEKTRSMVIHLDSQTNILIGISSAIFIFSAQRAQLSGENVLFFVLTIFSVSAALVALLAIHPPKNMRKRGQGESLMFNKKIMAFSTPAEYEHALGIILGDQNAMLREFSVEIYNLSKYYYRPKRSLFNLSRNILLFGIALSSLMFISRFISL